MRESWWLQYLKSLLLEILFVTTWSVFQNRVTYESTLTFVEVQVQVHGIVLGEVLK